MQVRLSDHFTYKKLFRFTIPTVMMMILTSMYTIVDGFFVSNFVGKIPFAAVNLVMPLIMGIASFGFMIGTGGSAIVSASLGEGEEQRAREEFSMLIKFAIILGISISAICFMFMGLIVKFLGATGELINYSIIYGRISMVGLTFFILQNIFNSFFVVAEKGKLNLIISIVAGLTNVFLDYLFIAVFNLGIAGAAYATLVGQILGGLFPLFYFSKKNTYLYFVKAKFKLGVLWRTFTNGSSELMSFLSSSIVNILYNLQLMRIIGENGIAAYGVFMYISFVFAAIIIGYSIGSAPIVSYNLGAENYEELQNIFRKSLRLLAVLGIILTVLSRIFSGTLLEIFVGYDEELFEISKSGFKIFSLYFIIFGFNIWGSAFFTALNDGLVSAVISFVRTLLFQATSVMILPLLFGLNGIWASASVAEVFALLVTIIFFINKRKKYYY